MKEKGPASQVKIRKAGARDFKELYALGANTPELGVSASEPFMEADDFRLRMKDKTHLFLVAEAGGKIVGFACMNFKDADRPLRHKYGGLVYIAVLPEFRRKGIATTLYEGCVKESKRRGITHLYLWANSRSKGIIKFMEMKGFAKGHEYVWMDKRI